MRMYNPEWEAIRHSELISPCTDLQFDLEGSSIPADHGQSLYEALIACLPELGTLAELAVHPVAGAPSGRDDTLVLNRRTKLFLRIPSEQVELALRLCGCQLETPAGRLKIGSAKCRPLLPFPELHSPLIVLGTHDEMAFMEAARQHLALLDIQGVGLICNKRRTIMTPAGEYSGFGLMVHGLSPAQSLRLQERGLGTLRERGCGVFVPHKSIKEVALD